MHARELVGLDSLSAVTTLLQRVRTAHPTFGLFEAADVQWWWSKPRATDSVPQLVWFDEVGRPDAAVVLTEWVEWIGIDPFVMPGATPEQIAHVFERGVAHAERLGFVDLGLEVDRDDPVLREVVIAHGFEAIDDGVIETWLGAGDRPPVSRLGDGYRLVSRSEVADRPHHMIGRSGAEVEARLRQTSLYRPELDLVVFDSSGEPVAYGLFWYDPVSATGLVEPMRTEDPHQRRGLARHVLTSGIDLLARAGATRIKICYEPSNPPAGELYLGVGFRPDRTTDVFRR